MAEPIALQVKPPQVMTLADMVNVARGAQAYQQAEQVNPLVAEKAQMEINQLQKMNPLAFSKAKEELSQQQTKTESDQLALQQKKFKEIQDSQIAMINNPLIVEAEKNPDTVDKKKLLNLVMQRGLQVAETHKIPKDEALKILQPYAEMAMNNPSALRGAYKESHIKGLDAASRTSALTPSGVAVDYSTGGQVTATNPFSDVPQGTAIPGTQYNKGLAPQLATSETGLPRQYGGGGAAGIVNPARPNVALPPVQQRQPAPNAVMPPPAVPLAPARAPAPVSGAAQGMGQQFGARGGVEITPGETVEAYKARIADLSAKPKMANNALSLANRDSVVNQEYNNNQVLSLLDKKDLDIGPLASAIANKTGGLGLSDDQQKIVKYLEQRIRMESARSNQDESSQRNAFGSFKNSKEALREIIYNDKGLLASQRLYNQGILKAQGNPNQPNLAAINNFENNFNQLNQDPHLPHLLGVMGNKKMEQLTDSEKRHLNKYFEKMSDDEIRRLFADRDALLNLVRGGR
jgi:hypothetical protein